jgi:hypothetical protein
MLAELMNGFAAGRRLRPIPYRSLLMIVAIPTKRMIVDAIRGS